MKIIVSNKQKHLGELVTERMNGDLIITKRETFNNGEVLYSMPNHFLYNDEVIVVWEGVSKDSSSNFMELLILLDMIRNNDPAKIHVVLPLVPYSRQDQRFGSQQPMSLRLVGQLLATVGVSSLFTFDLHSAQSESAFLFPVYNLTALPYMVDELIRDYSVDNFVFASPDMGSYKRNGNLARFYDVSLVVFHKQRLKSDLWVSDVLGNVENKDVIITEDMIDTGKTMKKCVTTLKENGANRVFIVATHSIFSIIQQTMFECDYDGLYVSDSIRHDLLPRRTKVINLSPLFCLALEEVLTKKSFPLGLMEGAWFLQKEVYQR